MKSCMTCFVYLLAVFSIIKAYWAKLMLFFAIYIACIMQVGFESFDIFIEVIAK